MPLLAMSLLEIAGLVFGLLFVLCLATFAWHGLRYLLGHRPAPNEPEEGVLVHLGRALTLLALVVGVMGIRHCQQRVREGAFVKKFKKKRHLIDCVFK